MASTDGLLLPGDLRVDTIERHQLSNEDLTLLLDYETQFLKAKRVAESLYCDRCFKADRQDGCRAGVHQNGLSGVARIECRCRILETAGRGYM